MYSLKPENYLRFLSLEPDQACMYLGMGGANADRLRDITHELAREIYLIKRR